MPVVALKFGACLTREQARQAWTEGQKKFWIAKPDFSTFFPIGQNPATYPLNIKVELPYGDYILGAGFGRCKLRKKFRIDLMGVHWL